MSQKSNIIPGLKYADAPAAIDWLCTAFDFNQHLVVPAEDNKIAHAQLTYRGCMIMLGSTGNGDLDKYMKASGDLRGINTQSAYLIVEDIDEHYARAKAAGAKMIVDIKDEDYGGRGYTCQDPQGVLWSFGSYDPWAEVTKD
jgi:uncharacterized glyoxalase superfamily protein PhnB